jgi:26S proteasome regulatory subunit N12
MNNSSRARSLISNYNVISDDKQKNDIMKQLTLLMLSFNTLPPSNQKMDKEEFLIAREILELEMDKHLAKLDGKSFELAYLKIKQFYFDYKNELPKSDRMLYFVGLYLLHLLANNRTTEFCTELELLDISDFNNSYVKVSRDLEQCIMEGNYKHQQQIKNTINMPAYKYYLEKFDDAIRFQIARSAEKSYENLKIEDAVKMLMLKNSSDLNNFISIDMEREDYNNEIEWKILNDRVHFIPVS